MGSSGGILSEETKISIKLLLTIIAIVVVPMVGGGFHMIRTLDGIKNEVALLRRDFVAQDGRVSGAVTWNEFQTWILLNRERGIDLHDAPPH